MNYTVETIKQINAEKLSKFDYKKIKNDVLGKWNQTLSEIQSCKKCGRNK